MSQNITIRDMTEVDLPECLVLAAQLGYPDNSIEEFNQRYRHIEMQDQDELFVAELSGKVVGWLHMEASWCLEIDHRARVSAIVVSEAHRGKGIGKQMMEFAETWAKERGFSIISLNSRIQRKDAHKFYETLGYEKSKEQYQFTKKFLQ